MGQSPGGAGGVIYAAFFRKMNRRHEKFMRELAGWRPRGFRVIGTGLSATYFFAGLNGALTAPVVLECRFVCDLTKTIFPREQLN